MLLGVLFAILGGWLTDRYGPKPVFISIGVFSFIGLALTSQVSELWHLFLSYSLLVAIGTGPTYAVSSSIATRWFPRRRGIALGIVSSGVGLGSILVAPVAAYLIADYGWRMSYLIIGIVALIVMIPLSLLLKRSPGETTIISSENERNIIGSNASNTLGENIKEPSVGEIIKTRNFLLLMSIWFFYSFCLFMVMTHVVPYATDLGITSLQAAAIISISGFSNIPARIIMGLVSDRFGRKLIGLICASLMLVAMVWLTQSSSLWMLYVFAIVFGAAYGGLSPCSTAVVGDMFGVRHIGFVFGLLEVGWVCGAAAGPALAGYLFDITGSYYSAFIFGIFASLVIILLFPFLRLPASKGNNPLSGNKS